jgi:hypothetical protein
MLQNNTSGNLPVKLFTSNESLPAGLDISIAGALTYGEFLYMLGTLNFKLKSIFIEAKSIAQVNQPYRYTIRDSTGTHDGLSLKPKVDPNQQQPSLLLVPSGDLILNGFGYLSFTILPEERLSLRLDAWESSSKDVGPNNLVNNFNRMRGL